MLNCRFTHLGTNVTQRLGRYKRDVLQRELFKEDNEMELDKRLLIWFSNDMNVYSRPFFQSPGYNFTQIQGHVSFAIKIS